jgi:hypothetical protein
LWRALCLLFAQVQDAILHNKRIFEHRMLSDSRALQRRVLHGWQQVLQQRATQHGRLDRAQGRLQRGVLLRVFFSWKDELHHADRTLAMTRKVGAGCCLVEHRPSQPSARHRLEQ